MLLDMTGTYIHKPSISSLICWLGQEEFTRQSSLSQPIEERVQPDHHAGNWLLRMEAFNESKKISPGLGETHWLSEAHFADNIVGQVSAL